MKKSRIIIEIIAFLLAVTVTVTGLLHLGSRLLPAHYEYGSAWDTYLAEEKDSLDVMFFGSSLSYCDIVPAQIYTQSGIRSFVNAGSSQTLAVSRQYLAESLKTQTPSVAFLEITGAFYKQYTEYSTLNVVYMPFGMARLRAGLSCEEQARMSAVFPLYESHERIFMTPAERYGDQKQAAEQTHYAHMSAGFTFCEAGEAQTVTERSFVTVPGTKTYEDNLNDIRSFADCCEKNGIRLVLYLAPCMARIPADLRQQLFADLADVPCAALEDWTELGDSIGVSAETDWYDNLHFNFRGAAKFSAFLSDYILQLGLTPKSGVQDELWQQRADWWHSRCESCGFSLNE